MRHVQAECFPPPWRLRCLGLGCCLQEPHHPVGELGEARKAGVEAPCQVQSPVSIWSLVHRKSLTDKGAFYPYQATEGYLGMESEGLWGEGTM